MDDLGNHSDVLLLHIILTVEHFQIAGGFGHKVDFDRVARLPEEIILERKT